MLPAIPRVCPHRCRKDVMECNGVQETDFARAIIICPVLGDYNAQESESDDREGGDRPWKG